MKNGYACPKSSFDAGMHCGDAPGHIPVLHSRETSLFDHPCEALLIRKFLNAFDKIPIGLSVTGDCAPKGRDQRIRILLVERIQYRHVHLRKFKAKKTAAGLQNAESFIKRALD